MTHPDPITNSETERSLDPLFSEAALGPFTLKNRIVMAPMTRSRATTDHIPTEIMAEYYAARAEAGLLITEGTSPSPNGLGYARIPGLYSKVQAEAWRRVTDAVHERGGLIFVQLMHTGRASHPLNMPPGARVVAPSAVALKDPQYNDQNGFEDAPVPEAMSLGDIEAAQMEHAESAALAVEVAGFDGVELHGANGYLINQFLNPASNLRDDAYGGDIEGRLRFLFETIAKVTEKIGPDRTALRISPFGTFNDMAVSPTVAEEFRLVASRAQEAGLAYLHVVEGISEHADHRVPGDFLGMLRAEFSGPLILNGGYDAVRAAGQIKTGLADFVSFGRPFIANADLVTRFRAGVPLQSADPQFFYTPGPEGYL